MSAWEILIASSDLEGRRNVVSILDGMGLVAFCASNVSECREILENQNVRLVFCDRSFADGDYRDVLAAASHRAPGAGAHVVLLSIRSDPEQYRKAKDQGVFEVISAPCRPTDVEWMVIQARRAEQKYKAHLLSVRSAGAIGDASRSVRAV
jgi:DNA-binding NtrC family response regulator